MPACEPAYYIVFKRGFISLNGPVLVEKGCFTPEKALVVIEPSIPLSFSGVLRYSVLKPRVEAKKSFVLRF